MYDSERHSWIGDRMGALRGVYVPSDLRSWKQAVGTEGVVAGAYGAVMQVMIDSVAGLSAPGRAAVLGSTMTAFCGLE
jgi:hypothetical protein